MNERKNITLKVADYLVADRYAVIETTGIGSCLVVCLYDENAKVGGMAHCMLPTRYKNSYRADDSEFEEKKGKYVDESIDKLIEDIESIGGQKQNLKAKLVGGAQMFSAFSGRSNFLGEENVKMAKKKLWEHGIPVVGEDIGGSIGRSAVFNIESGILSVAVKM